MFVLVGFVSFSQIQRLEKILPKFMGYSVVLGTPERLSGKGSQLVPPQLSAALGPVGGTRVVPRAPWGTTRLPATLVMPHRKDGASLCQALGEHPGPGRQLEGGVGLRRGFRAVHKAGKNGLCSFYITFFVAGGSGILVL